MNGEKWIISKRHKTKVPFQVKLLPVPLEIIERYRHIRTDNHVFGTCNYWSMGKQLKRVIYAKITTEKLDTDITAFGDKLSASFNNITLAGL